MVSINFKFVWSYCLFLNSIFFHLIKEYDMDQLPISLIDKMNPNFTDNRSFLYRVYNRVFAHEIVDELMMQLNAACRTLNKFCFCVVA